MESNDMAAKFSHGPALKTHKLFLGAQVGLRVLTIATTFAAAWVMITNKQTFQFGDFVFHARYSYSSAFKFFVIANFVACAFSVLSLLSIFLVGRPGCNPANFFFLFLHDLVMMSLVLAGCSAATTMGLLGKNGNSQAGWMPICDNFAAFCSRGTRSVILSYVALVSLLTLTVISANKSRKI